MANRITLRGRGRGCAASDYNATRAAVSLIETRVKFIPGRVTGDDTDDEDGVKCGDGTRFPMKVTQKQLAEIFYRVRDAWFTAGSYDEQYLNAIDPPAALVFLDSIELPITFDGLLYGWCRGYWICEGDEEGDGGFAVGANYDDLFDSSYDPMGAGITASMDIGYVREANSEFSMWCHVNDDDTTEEKAKGTETSVNKFRWGYQGITTSIVYYAFPWFDRPFGWSGLNHYSIKLLSGGDDDTSYYGMNPSGTLVCQLTGRVAYLGNHPFEEDAELYVELFMQLEFAVETWSGKGYGAAGIDFKIALSDSVVSCPLYLQNAGPAASGTDFILTAKKWWPYATTAVVDAWSETTGLPINDGPGA